MPQKVVVFDENPLRRNYLRTIICHTGAVPFLFDTASILLDNINPIAPDLVVAGPLPLEQACRIILSLKAGDPRLPLVILSEDPHIKDFIRRNDLGKVTVIGSEVDSLQLEGTVGTLMQERRAAAAPEPLPPVVVGNCAEMVRLRGWIEDLSQLDVPVLVQGEAGTGKELIARSIYHRSPRCGAAFVKFDAASLPQTTGEAAPGAALLGRALRAAAGGVLLLHGVEMLAPHLQAALIGVLDGDGVLPGASAADVRLIFTAHPRLDGHMAHGGFRRDLFYRLDGFCLTVPPLRRRADDIGLLADFFADQCSAETGTGHFDLSPSLKDLLMAYTWPGNVAELREVVQAAVSHGSEQAARTKLTRMIRESNRLLPGTRPAGVDDGCEFAGLGAFLRSQGDLSLKHICRSFTEPIERRLIELALSRAQWNRREAARQLGISYKSILNKIKRYQLQDQRQQI